MSESAAVYRIADWQHPRLPLAVRIFNLLSDSLAQRLFPVHGDSLLELASRRTGLTDFGDEEFREPLQLIAEALESEAGLTPVGRVSARTVISQLLTTRLYTQELLIRHPEIRELPVRSPIIIVGLPRTGTTHLHNLVCQDPSLRWLPFWESEEPLRDPRTRPWWPDLRAAKAALKLKMGVRIAPLMPLMHEMGAKLPHEELQLSAVAFRSFFFETAFRIPSYRRWYAAADHTAGYDTLREILQVLQWTRGGGRWALKSPQHLDQLRPLMKTFPDARVIRTHRDPVKAVLSLTTMLVYSARVFHKEVDPVAEARACVDRIEQMLRASIRDEALVPPSQVLHVRFQEFMTNPWDTMKRVFEFSEQPFEDSARAAVQAHLAANPRGKHGKVAYSFSDLGLDEEELRERLRFYQEHFDLPDELPS